MRLHPPSIDAHIRVLEDGDPREREPFDGLTITITDDHEEEAILRGEVEVSPERGVSAEQYRERIAEKWRKAGRRLPTDDVTLN